jgi:uncharacterized membrane protein
MTIAKRIPGLVVLLVVGAFIRFWHLELKPLWMDEVITALFSFGRTYYDVPLEQFLPVSSFEQVFRLNSAATCAQITQTVAIQSVHPPLFFCWMHQWLSGLNGLPLAWVWKLRAFPALIGVVAIAALYQLNALAFSRKAALIGAAIMAMSPFAVYLSQEARHYTLPMLFVILALSGLYQILLDQRDRQFRPSIWCGWMAVNSLGFYIHYFFLLAFAAQVVVLMVEGSRQWAAGNRQQAAVNPSLPDLPSPPSPSLPSGFFLLLPLLAIALVCLAYLPWLPTLLTHMNRPETDWVKVNAPGLLATIAPLFQIVSGWVLAVIALPLENQPLGLAIVNGGLMALFSLWLAWRVGHGLLQLWQTTVEARLGIRLLVVFYLAVIAQFLAIAYLLGKDFTQVPRYNFIYFPALGALIGAGLSQPISAPNRIGRLPGARLWRISERHAVPIVLLLATLSSILVVSNQVFQKPYQPERVTGVMLQESSPSLFVTTAYQDFQDIALGLSFALQLEREWQQTRTTEPHATFIAQENGYGRVWQQLAKIPHPLPSPVNLWVVAPGLKRIGYPQQLGLHQAGRSQVCTIDPSQHYRIGIPYQLYRCQ